MLSSVYQVFQKQTENEILVNYARDTEHCGQCGYNLTGNLTGICPECGWAIPQGPFQYQRPDWACWWKKWEIDYLDNWRKKLTSLVFWAVTFAALGVVLFYYTQNYAASILPMFMSLIFAINCIRIIAYARRQSSTAPLDERQD
ncbi:MAG: hypothetical protein JSV03_04245 [Planctomycetota bacterium]|nr:MAG: hypothetical protein JSV03_04245 [Planctomycetota bacterium]